MSMFASPTIFAVSIVIATALVAAMLPPLQVAIVMLVGGAAAVAVARSERRALPEAEPHTADTAAATNVRELVAALIDPVVIVERGRVSHANGAAQALLGAHIVGQDARIAIRHPAAAAALGGDAGRGPIDLVGIGGRDQHWRMHVAIAGDAKVVQLSNETGHRAAERMRVDFVANASHELRTPLAAILGYVETLADDAAGGDPMVRARFLGIVANEAHRMQRLIDELITLSRIEAEKFRVPDARVDLAALADEVAGEIRHATRGGEIRLAIADGVPPVAGDAPQLSQLLHNLIGNALKYGRAGEAVTVTIAPQADTVALSVADRGDGIEAHHLPRLTERFYRVDPGRSRALGGTGLGLAIVKHIVERHRGRLDIASTPGVGTTVTVTLPAAIPGAVIPGAVIKA